MKYRKIFVVLFLITFISKVLGFIRETTLAYYYGTNKIVDVYILSLTISTVVFGCLEAVAISITPIYTKAQEKGAQYANKVLNNVISWMIFIAVIFLLFLEVFLDKIILLIARQSSYEERILLVRFARMTLLTVVINPMFKSMLSFLRIKEKYIVAGIIELLVSGVQIVFIIFSGIFANIYLLPVGYLAANSACLLMSLFVSKKIGFNLQIELRLLDETKDMFQSIIPVFLSAMLVQINAFVDKMFASRLESGVISALGYANTIKNLLYAFFTIIIIDIYYPHISRLIAGKEYVQAKKKMTEYINFMLVIMTPITVFFAFFSKEIVKVIYQHGSFDAVSTQMTSSAFQMYAAGILAISVRDLLLRYYYSLEIKKPVIFLSLFTIGVNIIFNFILVGKFGHQGLAMATSLSAILSLPLYFYSIPAKDRLYWEKIIAVFLFSIFVSLFANMVTRSVYKKSQLWGQDIIGVAFLRLCWSFIICICLYLLIMALSKKIAVSLLRKK